MLLRKLAENLEFEDVDSFKYNLELLAEGLIAKTSSDDYEEEYLDEAEVSENYTTPLEETYENEGLDEGVNKYLKFVEK